MRKVVAIALAAAVATNGTFAVSYPTGYTKGDFALGHKHQLVLLQSVYKAPKDFTVSFGASSATITWLGTTTIPAGSTGFFGFDLAGPDNYADTPVDQSRLNAFRESKLVLVNLGSPVVADIDALIKAATGSELVTTGGSVTYTWATQGGSSPLDGVITDGIIGSAPNGPGGPARNITATWTHASSIAACTIDLLGYNTIGDLQEERLAYASGSTTGTVTGVKAFASLISATITETGGGTAAGNTLNMGFGAKLGLPFPVIAKNQIVGELHSNVLQGPWRDNFVLNYTIRENLLGTGSKVRIPIPVNGVLIGHQAVVNTTADSGTGTLHVSVTGANTNGDGTTVAGLDIVITTAATIGSVFEAAATEGDSSQQASQGGQIVIAPGAGFTTGADIVGNITMRPTYTLRGTLVVADVSTTPTSTSGDNLGTYSPAFTLDGQTSIQLWVATADAQSHGTPQYRS